MLGDFIAVAFMITDPVCVNINVWSPELFFQVNSIYHYLFVFAKILDVWICSCVCLDLQYLYLTFQTKRLSTVEVSNYKKQSRRINFES